MVLPNYTQKVYLSGSEYPEEINTYVTEHFFKIYFLSHLLIELTF